MGDNLAESYGFGLDRRWYGSSLIIKLEFRNCFHMGEIWKCSRGTAAPHIWTRRCFYHPVYATIQHAHPANYLCLNTSFYIYVPSPLTCKPSLSSRAVECPRQPSSLIIGGTLTGYVFNAKLGAHSLQLQGTSILEDSLRRLLSRLLLIWRLDSCMNPDSM